jgi:anti-anti-sigma factor
MSERADVHVSHDDGVAVVSLGGEIDLLSAADVTRAVEAAIDGTGGVIVDLGGVAFMDSQGVALLDRLGGRLDREGRGLVIVAPTTSIPRRVLEIVDLGIALFEDRTSARAALRGTPAGDGSRPAPGGSTVH